MAEVAVGSDLVVALENMAERSGVEDLKWAVEAVRIQQSTGGRLAPILHTLAAFMRTRQEVRREVQTLSAEGRMSGYVLFAIPLFLVVALEMKDPELSRSDAPRRRADRADRHGRPHGAGVLDRAPHGQHQGLRTKGDCSRERGIFRSVGRHHAHGCSASSASAWRPGATHRSRNRLDFIRSLGTEAEVVRRAGPNARSGADAARQPGLRPGGARPAPRPVAPVPVAGHRPRPRRPAEGRPHRLGAGRGVRRHPGGRRSWAGFGHRPDPARERRRRA